MTSGGLARYAPLTGLLAIVFGAVGGVLSTTWADEPGSKASGAEIAAWMTDKSWAIIVSGWLWWLAGLSFLWFLASLRSVLGRGEGGDRRVTTIAFSSGTVAVALFMLTAVPIVTGAAVQEFDDRTLTPSLAESLFVLGNGGGIFLAVELTVGVLAVASAIVVLRTAVLPKWYGWLDLVYGIWLLIIPIGWIGLIGFPIWILLTTVLVYRAESSAPSAAAAVASV
jgi:hypothetical protein